MDKVRFRELHKIISERVYGRWKQTWIRELSS